MPILTIQRRHAELGRIRLGDKGDRGQPQKLTQFRITSPNERHIRDIAQLYGGQPQPWRNGSRDEWEVYTDTKSIPVIVVKGGITQWLETWSGGGCTHRCDGINNALTGDPCDTDDPLHVNAKPTTRLSVMLRELDAIGVWRLESHGWNAAAELPGLVDLAMHVGEMVPANLYLREQVSVRDGRTNKFIVPGLDLEVSPGRLVAIVSGQTEALRMPPSAQTPTAIQAEPAVDWFAVLADATTADECRALWHQAKHAGQLSQYLDDAITNKGRALAAAAEANGGAVAPGMTPNTGTTHSVSGPVEEPSSAPPLPNDDLDDLYFVVLAVAGKQNMTEPQVREDYYAWTGGYSVEEATPETMRGYLEHLRSVTA